MCYQILDLLIKQEKSEHELPNPGFTNKKQEKV